MSDGIHVDFMGDRCRAWVKYGNARSPNEAPGPVWVYGTAMVHHAVEGDDAAPALQAAIRQVREHVEMLGVEWMDPCVFWASRCPGEFDEDPEFEQILGAEAARFGWRFDDGHPA